MGVTVNGFGEAKEYVLSGGELEVAVLDYGATIRAIRFAGKDLCLGYDDLDTYKHSSGYLGATVGRYANRIRDGRFTLNGKLYDVGRNENGYVHLHGGKTGLDKKFWNAEILSGGEPAVRFTVKLADGEEGYPGNMNVAVTFSIAGSALRLTYDADTDADTVFNPTNHTYFNVSGGGTALSTVLTIYADAFLPLDGRQIPTGEMRKVEGTPFDFREGKPIGRDIAADDPQIKIGGGYDINFILGATRGERTAATAYSPESGIVMECRTDMPGVQFYTACGLNNPHGKGGVPLGRYDGFCLETQFFPDSPNRPEFPSPVLRAGEKFHSVTEYAFSVKKA